MSITRYVPLIIRGEIVADDAMEHGGRRGGVSFRTADVSRHAGALLMRDPARLADLHQLRFEDIVDYLGRLAERLELARNPHLQDAFELARSNSGLSDAILRDQYENIPAMLQPEVIRATADRTIGIPYLEGWVERPRGVLSGCRIRVRAFGARSVHIIAGNVPGISVQTLIWNAITRSDAIIKMPSNDPVTAVALARTMIDMAPDHPITRHLSVAYWKGGDTAVEERLYDPGAIEKIVAWGGFAGVKHVARYLQPGLDLITLDPKHSSTIIGAEAFESEETMRVVAHRLALDIGVLNQEACFNARVVYAVSGTDAAGLARANRLGKLAFEALQQLPERISTPHKAFPDELRTEISNLGFIEDEYRVFGGKRGEGAMIVSQMDAPVDFAKLLAGRVGNIVPIDDIETALRSVNAYTQTIGIYPEALKRQVRDRLAFQGAQRIVSLGAATMMDIAGPQDGIEPLRRICKWILEEEADPAALDALRAPGRVVVAA